MLLSLFYILAVFLNMFITSAAGFGMLLMVTVYPILIGMGISKYSAVGMIVTTGCLELASLYIPILLQQQIWLKLMSVSILSSTNYLFPFLRC